MKKIFNKLPTTNKFYLNNNLITFCLLNNSNIKSFSSKSNSSYTGYDINYGKISVFRDSDFSLNQTYNYPSKYYKKTNYNKTHYTSKHRYNRINNYNLHNKEIKKRFIERNVNILNLKEQIKSNPDLFKTIDHSELRYVDNLENSNIKPIDTSKKNMNNSINYNSDKIKKRQELFNDLVSFERNLPNFQTSNTKLKGKELLAYIEKQYYEELVENERKEGLHLKKYMPKVGDKIEVEYYLSVSSGKFNRFTGICTNLYKENTSKFCFNFYTCVDGYYADLKFGFYSKIIKSISLLKPSEILKDKDNKVKNIVNYKNLIHMGHKAGLILKGGKHVNIKKIDVLNLKQRLRSPTEEKNQSNSTIYDV